MPPSDDLSIPTRSADRRSRRRLHAVLAPGRRPESPLRGIFPILQTPFTDAGALDLAMLAREVEFVHRCGVQGLTWPQLASEYATLTFDERTAGAETIVRAARRLDPGTRLAVVISVQAADIDTAVEYARPADAIGPDAIIAIPLDGGRDERRQEEY